MIRIMANPTSMTPVGTPLFPLRVLMISATYPPDVCGVGDYTFQLTKALQNLGVQVELVTSVRQAGEQNDGDRPVEVRSGQAPPVERNVTRWNLRTLFSLVDRIEYEGYDCVHIQYSPNFYGSLSFAVNLLPWLLLGTNCRTVVTFHEIYSPKLSGFRNRILSIVDYCKDTVLLLGASTAILTVPSRTLRLGMVFPWLKSRLHTIPVGTGVQVEPMEPDERTRQRAHLGVGEEELLLGSFGSMHVDRRYETLIRVLHGLKARLPKLRLAFLGAYREDHPYYQDLKKLIAENGLESYIAWTGYGTEQEISRWLSALDVYVMSDRRGASDRKSSLITAIAHGLPVISTFGMDTPPEFFSSESLVLVAVDDEQALSRHIEAFAQDTERRARFGSGAHRLFEANYAWGAIARKTIEAYDAGVKR